MAKEIEKIDTQTVAEILCVTGAYVLYLRKYGEIDAVEFIIGYGYYFDRAKIEAFASERTRRVWGKRAHERKAKRKALAAELQAA